MSKHFNMPYVFFRNVNVYSFLAINGGNDENNQSKNQENYPLSAKIDLS